MSSTTIKSVNCPTCQTEVEWTDANAFRPFCSKRCQLIDFGAWAGEQHAIAGTPVYLEDEQDPDSLQ